MGGNPIDFPPKKHPLIALKAWLPTPNDNLTTMVLEQSKKTMAADTQQQPNNLSKTPISTWV